MSGPENVPRGTNLCWGCQDPISDTSLIDYCEVCQVSLQLIRKLQEDGCRVLWTIPKMHADWPRV